MTTTTLNLLPPFDFVPVDSGTLGFPRIGPNRELKFALEKFWRHQLTKDQLYAVAHQLEEQNWHKQLESGVNRVAVGLFSLYDHVLDWISFLGCEPERFQHLQDPLERYFAMARGAKGVPALDMTKWLDTNYHYEVPELNGITNPSANYCKLLCAVTRALSVVGPNKTMPVLLGPLTFLSLSKIDTSTTSFEQLLTKILPIYSKLLDDLAALGIREVQVHEPSLVTEKASGLLRHLSTVYGDTSGATTTVRGALEHTDISLHLVTYFDEINEQVYQWFCGSRVAGLSLDFTRGDNLSLLSKFGFPNGKRLGAGVLDGRGIWKFRPQKTLQLLQELQNILRQSSNVELTLQPSCSLQHVPYTTACEKKLPEGSGLHSVLSFAYEKLQELQLLKRLATEGETAVQEELQLINKAWRSYAEQTPAKASVRERVQSVTTEDLTRPAPFEERLVHQLNDLPGLPLLPTTTIGSFPQTPHIRSLRKRLKTGQLSQEEYQHKIDEQIAFNIGIQEGTGLDILVHGEPERTDMVEFFAEKLDGFAFTQNGWVQSYGSRCVRPPIIYADLERPLPMTIREYLVAQSFTTKPVKGMLTGPVTILNWSFPRGDLSRKDQAFQLALCLRDEVQDLQSHKCKIIQVDEPALREGLPLHPSRKEAYLQWAVDAFRLATAIANKETCIHTHMCYCEFEDCLNAIVALDTDANSIENARSDDETIRSFTRIGYKHLLGPGVYDIHSPVVPPKEQIVDKLKSFLQLLPAKQVIVNPDCGLKTRGWKETIAALQNMVQATEQVRQEALTSHRRLS